MGGVWCAGVLYKSGRNGGQGLAQIEEVSGFERRSEQLVDDGEEVVKRGDWLQGRRVQRPEGSSSACEQECGMDDVERYSAIKESGGEASVGAPGEAGRAGNAAVEGEDTLGVVAAG
jgi:hypothetical protein